MLPLVAIALAIAAVLLSLGFVIVSISFVRTADNKSVEEANQYDIQKRELDTLEYKNKNGELTPNQYEEALKTINAPDTYPNVSIFDQIAGSIGIDKKTLIYVLVGILAFSLLRG